jgi:hypothetical protein
MQQQPSDLSEEAPVTNVQCNNFNHTANQPNKEKATHQSLESSLRLKRRQYEYYHEQEEEKDKREMGSAREGNDS